MINKYCKFVFVISFLLASTFINAAEKLVIIGKGPAGLSAAIYAGQAHRFPLVIEGQECDGQLIIVNRIENYPGFPEGISGEELIDRMHLQGEFFGARFQKNYAVEIDLKSKPFTIKLNNDEDIYAESIIIATGASPRWLNVPGEEALKNKGVSASATCDGPDFVGKSVVVAGGGDAALEQALFLTDYASKVTLVHRSDQLNASSYLIERVMSQPKIQLILNTQIESILGENEGWVKGILVKNQKTKTTQTLKCEAVFVAIGRKPNTDLFKSQLEMDSAGYIITKSGTTQTSIEGVFAAGDITPSVYRKVVTAAASGCMSALDATLYLDMRK